MRCPQAAAGSTPTHHIHEKARPGHDSDARHALKERREAVRVYERSLAARRAALQDDIHRAGSARDESGKDGVEDVAPSEEDSRITDLEGRVDPPSERATVTAGTGRHRLRFTPPVRL